MPAYNRVTQQFQNGFDLDASDLNAFRADFRQWVASDLSALRADLQLWVERQIASGTGQPSGNTLIWGSGGGSSSLNWGASPTTWGGQALTWGP